MSLPQFFLDTQCLAAEGSAAILLSLTPEDLRHAKALRLRPHEHIAVIDAEGVYYECEIDSMDATGVAVHISGRKDLQPSSHKVALVQGIAKGDKMDDIIRHATELGVDLFIPYACKRSVVQLQGKRMESKVARWQAIAKSASMQSGRFDIPSVLEPHDTSEVLSRIKDMDTVLVCWEEADGACSLSKALDRIIASVDEGGQAWTCVIIGPEGGLDEAEVDAFLSGSTTMLVSLGDAILRTETASLAACTLVAYALGRFGAVTHG